MLAAVRHARTLKPAKVIVGVPVGSEQACDRLRGEVDHLVCLAIPHLFCAIGGWYRDFQQVTDTEVQNLIAESRHRLRKHLAARAAA